MKVLGIEINGREVRMIALEHKDEIITNYTDGYKPIELGDDQVAKNVILFRNTLFSTFDNFAPEEIVIKYRNPKGKGMLAPSPISFKIEGLIQTYDKANISLVNPNTLAAYFKKYSTNIEPKYVYQTEALKVAFHHIKTKK